MLYRVHHYMKRSTAITLHKQTCDVIVVLFVSYMCALEAIYATGTRRSPLCGRLGMLPASLEMITYHC
jgi:hypothetical protein